MSRKSIKAEDLGTGDRFYLTEYHDCALKVETVFRSLLQTTLTTNLGNMVFSRSRLVWIDPADFVPDGEFTYDTGYMDESDMFLGSDPEGVVDQESRTVHWGRLNGAPTPCVRVNSKWVETQVPDLRAVTGEWATSGDLESGDLFRLSLTGDTWKVLYVSSLGVMCAILDNSDLGGYITPDTRVFKLL